MRPIFTGEVHLKKSVCVRERERLAQIVIERESVEVGVRNVVGGG